MIIELIVGTVFGICLSSLVFCVFLAKYKWENCTMKAAKKSLTLLFRQTDRNRISLRKKLIGSRSENHYLKGEIERLENDKLKSWGVPDGLE